MDLEKDLRPLRETDHSKSGAGNVAGTSCHIRN